MPLGYDSNGAIIEKEAAVVKYVYNKIIEYTNKPPADMVEEKVSIAKENGEEITYEEAAKLVTTSEIEFRIWDEIRANPEFVETIIAYNRRVGYNANPNVLIGTLRASMGFTSEPIVSREDWHKAQALCSKESVVLYARESKHADADVCLERQKEKLKDFCAEKGYFIADEVATIGSRSESLGRLKEAIECAKDTAGKTILMVSSNRVAGTHDELTEIADLLDESGVKISTIDGSYEYADKYGISPQAIMASTLAGFDAENDEDDLDEDEGMGMRL